MVILGCKIQVVREMLNVYKPFLDLNLEVGRTKYKLHTKLLHGQI